MEYLGRMAKAMVLLQIEKEREKHTIKAEFAKIATLLLVLRNYLKVTI